SLRVSESVAPEAVASGHTDEIIMEEAPSQGEQAVAHEKISVEANEIGTLPTEVHNLKDDFKMFKQLFRWMKGEFDSVKKLISSREQSSSAPPIPPPVDLVSSSGPSQARQQDEEAGPSGPSSIAEDRPSGQIVVEPVGPTGPQEVQKEPGGPSGPVKVVLGPSGPVKVVLGPTGSVVYEDVQSSVEELAVAPEAPEPSSVATPAPSSPPSSSTAPPAPPTFKQPRASFGKSSHFRFTLDKDQYVRFLEDQRQLYIERMHPEMGVSFTIDSGIFSQFFEEQEIKAWELISRHPWLREVGVAERRPMRTIRDVRSGRSSRPRHRRVLYFPHCRLWIMECSCKERADVWWASLLRTRFEDGAVDVAWDENLASRPVAAKISSLRPAILPSIFLNGQTLPLSSLVQNSLVGDQTPLEETVESDSERGE
ncbi:hypothetical protein Taro_033687, partial [Colocasia esculenta]|nr:hypothetical protein [Colocasia esculenta]